MKIKEEDQIHTLPYCVKVTGIVKISTETDVAFLVDQRSVLHSMLREQAEIKILYPQLRV